MKEEKREERDETREASVLMGFEFLVLVVSEVQGHFCYTYF